MDNNKIIEEVINISSAEESSVKISPDVVATIAGVSTTEINGVAGMCTSFAGGIAEMLGAKKNPTKGIKVEINENNVVIDLFIIVDFGEKIPQLAQRVQENVANNVETMTGLTVDKVNVHVDGVSFKKFEDEEKNKSNILVEDEIIVEDVELEEIPEDDEMQV